MKKFASIIVSALLLVALLSAMAISAALDLSGELCESKTYSDSVTINGDAIRKVFLRGSSWNAVFSIGRAIKKAGAVTHNTK